MKRLLLLLACGVLVFGYVERDQLAPRALGWIGMLSGHGQAAPAPSASAAGGTSKHGHGAVAVTIAAATSGSLPVTLDTIGNVVAVASTTLNSEVVGIISDIAVKDGADVKKGDLIVKLDDRAAKAVIAKDQAALAKDQAALVDSQASLSRIQSLVRTGADTKQAGDDALAAVNEAQASIGVDQATLNADEVTLSKTQIRSPFDGRLGAVQISLGALVQPGTAIVTVTEMRPVYAQFSLPETSLAAAEAAFARKTLTANVTPSLAPPGSPPLMANAPAPSPAGSQDNSALVASADPVGKVVFIDNTVDPASATFRLRALLANEDESLLPGQSLGVQVNLGNLDNLVLVPNVAVSVTDNGSIVYVVKPDDTIELRKVVVAMRAGGVAGLSSGLSQGERVVIEGQAELSNGAKVKVVDPHAGAASPQPGGASRGRDGKLAENGGAS